MAQTVISVENLSKSYQLGVIGTGTFRGDLQRWWARLRRQPDPTLKIDQADHINHEGETLWALKDVSFQVRQGEAVGIIGRNGAGKSTLLKILSQVTAPTSGGFKAKGRIASLLEVGTGFHPELTGRENIYLNGAIMGMSRAEVASKFDEIVDFSGVEQFIDTPVKRYSSGMYVRLAFAVAAHLEPEILVVDEVLAVGDAEFQKKCLGKMGDVANEGRTVLFVSHNMAAIESLCERVVFLKAGELIADGISKDVLSQYLIHDTVDSSIVDLRSHPGRRSNMKPILSEVSLMREDGFNSSNFQIGDQITFQILLESKEGVYDSPGVSISIFNHLNLLVCKLNSKIQSQNQWELDAKKKISCIWPDCRLAPGRYPISVSFGNGEQLIDFIENAVTINIIGSDIFGTGKISSGLFLPSVQWASE